MNHREIKNRIAFKIGFAVPRVEKYKIGTAVQILETIRLAKSNVYRLHCLPTVRYSVCYNSYLAEQLFQALLAHSHYKIDININ